MSRSHPLPPERQRRLAVKDARSVVVKVGTRLLTDTSRIPWLVENLAVLKAQGRRLILVSSGAVGLGLRTLGLSKRPRRIERTQALASIGQSKLMALYEEAARPHGFHVAQLLLTADALANRESHLNAMNCLNALWELGVLPIVNENDAVALEGLRFGDNDILAALVAAMTKSELTIILTSVDGLKRPLPGGGLGERVSLVAALTDDIRGMATGTDDGTFSVGGMSSKVKAADIVTSSGEALWVADGMDKEVFRKIFAGEDVGTLFVPPAGARTMPSRKRWLSFFSGPRGRLVVDDGAAKAVVRHGRSLLPSGLRAVEGEFQRGDMVEIADESGAVIARGLSNYSSEDVRRLRGLKSADIHKVLGFFGDEELVHRDNLTVARRAAAGAASSASASPPPS